MPKGQRFPLEVMLCAMREVDNGVPVGVVCRKIEMVDMRLKKLLSEQLLHDEALRDVLSKNGEARGTPSGLCGT